MPLRGWERTSSGFHVGRRLSPLIAGIGLIGALAWFGLGSRGQTPTSGPDTAPLAADVAARLRETLAGVQARADTLAQLPRLGLAVATDERTVRDLTTDELAFRTKRGEHIEIAQIARSNGHDGAVHSLLRLPDDKLPLAMASLGPHLMVADGRVQVVVYVSVTPRDRTDELRGALAVAQAPDFTSFRPRLDELGLTAKIEVAGKAAALMGGEAPAGAPGSPIPLATAAPEATTLAFVGGLTGSSPRGGRPIVGPLVLLLVALAGAAALRGRAEAPLPAPAPAAPAAAVPSSPHRSRPVAEPPVGANPAFDRPAPSRAASPAPPSGAVPAAPAPVRPIQSGPVPATTPSGGVRVPPARPPSVPPLPPAAPMEMARAGSGPTPAPDAFDDEPTQAPEPLRPISAAREPSRPISIARKPTPAPHLPPPAPHLPPPAPQLSAAAHLPPAAPRPARPRTASQPPRPGVTTLPSWLFEVAASEERPTSPVRASIPAEEDTLGREYRALYAEFINMRRTCRESVDNLDADRFIAALRQQHDELCQKYPSKEIRFRLAFDNGKAAIRFVVA